MSILFESEFLSTFLYNFLSGLWTVVFEWRGRFLGDIVTKQRSI